MGTERERVISMGLWGLRKERQKGLAAINQETRSWLKEMATWLCSFEEERQASWGPCRLVKRPSLEEAVSRDPVLRGLSAADLEAWVNIGICSRGAMKLHYFHERWLKTPADREKAADLILELLPWVEGDPFCAD